MEPSFAWERLIVASCCSVITVVVVGVDVVVVVVVVVVAVGVDVIVVIVVVVVTRSDVVTFLSPALLLFGDLTLPGIFD